MLIKQVASGQSLGISDLITYEQDGNPHLGVIVGYTKPRYRILNQQAGTLDLDPVRLHKLPGVLPKTCESTADKQKFLKSLHERALELQQKLELEELWDLLKDENGNYSNAELCQNLFNTDDTAEHLAVRYALIADKVFFKRKEEVFSPRPLETVAELKKAEAARKKKEQSKSILVETLAKRIKGDRGDWPPEVIPQLELLEDLAADSTDLDNAKKREGKLMITEISEVLRLELNGTIPQRALGILKLCGHFNDFTNLAILRHRPPTVFSAEVQKAAHHLANKLRSAKFPDRLDLTSLQSFTVDDASTMDMDDALSVERTDHGHRIGIHIGDVASLIEKDCPLDLAALERASSIYSPNGNINMLPEILSEDCLSLRSGEIRPALSFLIDIDRGYAVKEWRVERTLVKSHKKFSYDQMDELLEADGDFNTIYNVASAWEAERFRRGGFKVQKRDVNITLGPDAEVFLTEIDENGPARGTIGELMVLANSLAAEFAQRHNFPIVYRAQETSEKPDEEEEIKSDAPHGPAQDYAQRAKLKKSNFSTRPARHNTLGLSAYTQVTSPIRRYLDICTQRQIIGFLEHGKALYSEEELREVLDKVEENLKRALGANREGKKFWLLRYLEGMAKRRETIQGTVIRNDLKNPLVELDRVFFGAFVRTSRKPKLGEILNLRLASVDANYDYLKLEEV